MNELKLLSIFGDRGSSDEILDCASREIGDKVITMVNESIYYVAYFSNLVSRKGRKGEGRMLA